MQDIAFMSGSMSNLMRGMIFQFKAQWRTVNLLTLEVEFVKYLKYLNAERQ